MRTNGTTARTAGENGGTTRPRRRGSALVVSIGTLALIAVAAAVYVTLGQADERTARVTERAGRAEEIAQRTAEYLAGIVADDRLDVFLEATGAAVDRASGIPIATPAANIVAQRYRREAFDYPYTDTSYRSVLGVGDFLEQAEGDDDFVPFLRFRPTGQHVARPEAVANAADRPFSWFNDPRVPNDPWLASTEPASAAWTHEGFNSLLAAQPSLGRVFSQGRTLDFPSDGLPNPELYYLDNRDWLNISNPAPDGRFVNLFNLRNNFEAESGFGNDADGRPRISANLTLIEPLIVNEGMPQASLLGASTNIASFGLFNGELDVPSNPFVNIPAVWTSNQRFMFFPLSETFPFRDRSGNIAGWGSPDFPLYSYADADGDGMADSRWFELIDATLGPENPIPLLGDTGDFRIFVAARIIDLSSMVNVNTATDSITATTSSYPAGATPADIDVRRILTMEDVSRNYAPRLNLELADATIPRSQSDRLSYAHIQQPGLAAGFSAANYGGYAFDVFGPGSLQSPPAVGNFSGWTSLLTGRFAYDSLRRAIHGRAEIPTVDPDEGVPLFGSIAPAPEETAGLFEVSPFDPFYRPILDAPFAIPTQQVQGGDSLPALFDINGPDFGLYQRQGGAGFARADYYDAASRALLASAGGALTRTRLFGDASPSDGTLDPAEPLLQGQGAFGTRLFGIQSLTELLTFHGLNDDAVYSPLEQALDGRFRDENPNQSTTLSADERRFGPLRSNRPTDLERLTHDDNDLNTAIGIGDQPGVIDESAMALFALSPRKRLTTFSGGALLTNAVIADPGRDPRRGVNQGYESIVADALGTLSEREARIDLWDRFVIEITDRSRDALDGPQAANGAQHRVRYRVIDDAALFRFYADALAPDASTLFDHTNGDGTGTSERFTDLWLDRVPADRFDTLFYGHRGPELATRIAAHMAVNFADQFDSDDIPTVRTLLLDEAFRGDAPLTRVFPGSTGNAPGTTVDLHSYNYNQTNPYLWWRRTKLVEPPANPRFPALPPVSTANTGRLEVGLPFHAELDNAAGAATGLGDGIQELLPFWQNNRDFYEAYSWTLDLNRWDADRDWDLDGIPARGENNAPFSGDLRDLDGAAVLPPFRNRNASGRLFDSEFAGAELTVGGQLGDTGPGATAIRPSRRAINVYGVEPQPFLTEAGMLITRTYALGAVSPMGMVPNIEVQVPAMVDTASDFGLIYFQVTNPFDEPVRMGPASRGNPDANDFTLTPGAAGSSGAQGAALMDDYDYYFEYNGIFYLPGHYAPDAASVPATPPPGVLPASLVGVVPPSYSAITLDPGETAVFFATADPDLDILTATVGNGSRTVEQFILEQLNLAPASPDRELGDDRRDVSVFRIAPFNPLNVLVQDQAAATISNFTDPAAFTETNPIRLLSAAPPQVRDKARQEARLWRKLTDEPDDPGSIFDNTNFSADPQRGAFPEPERAGGPNLWIGNDLLADRLRMRPDGTPATQAGNLDDAARLAITETPPAWLHTVQIEDQNMDGDFGLETGVAVTNIPNEFLGPALVSHWSVRRPDHRDSAGNRGADPGNVGVVRAWMLQATLEDPTGVAPFYNQINDGVIRLETVAQANLNGIGSPRYLDIFSANANLASFNNALTPDTQIADGTNPAGRVTGVEDVAPSFAGISVQPLLRTAAVHPDEKATAIAGVTANRRFNIFSGTSADTTLTATAPRIYTDFADREDIRDGDPGTPDTRLADPENTPRIYIPNDEYTADVRDVDGRPYDNNDPPLDFDPISSEPSVEVRLLRPADLLDVLAVGPFSTDADGNPFVIREGEHVTLSEALAAALGYEPPRFYDRDPTYNLLNPDPAQDDLYSPFSELVTNGAQDPKVNNAVFNARTNLPTANTLRFALDRGRLRLDDFAPYINIDENADTFTSPRFDRKNIAGTLARSDIRAGDGAPIATRILSNAHALAGRRIPFEEDGRLLYNPLDLPTVGLEDPLTRLVPGTININTAPLAVLRSLPGLAPTVERRAIGTGAGLREYWPARNQLGALAATDPVEAGLPDLSTPILTPDAAAMLAAYRDRRAAEPRLVSYNNVIPAATVARQASFAPEIQRGIERELTAGNITWLDNSAALSLPGALLGIDLPLPGGEAQPPILAGAAAWGDDRVPGNFLGDFGRFGRTGIDGIRETPGFASFGELAAATIAERPPRTLDGNPILASLQNDGLYLTAGVSTAWELQISNEFGQLNIDAYGRDSLRLGVTNDIMSPLLFNFFFQPRLQGFPSIVAPGGVLAEDPDLPAGFPTAGQTDHRIGPDFAFGLTSGLHRAAKFSASGALNGGAPFLRAETDNRVEADSLTDDYSERLALLDALSNVADVRSDVYAAWFILRGYREQDVNDLDDDEPMRPSLEKRYLMVIDRSNVTRRGQPPRVLLFKEVPL